MTRSWHGFLAWSVAQAENMRDSRNLHRVVMPMVDWAHVCLAFHTNFSSSIVKIEHTFAWRFIHIHFLAIHCGLRSVHINPFVESIYFCMRNGSFPHLNRSGCGEPFLQETLGRYFPWASCISRPRFRGMPRICFRVSDVVNSFLYWPYRWFTPSVSRYVFLWPPVREIGSHQCWQAAWF